MPSENLMQLLRELQVCNARGVAACQRSVRRLCKELPDFDSVWLDALIQRDCLTPWQAEILQSDDPWRLRIDDVLLTEQIGDSSFCGRAGSDTLYLKRFGGVTATASELLAQLNVVSAQAPHTILLPKNLLDNDGDTFLVSDFVPGYNLEELLIRGGRIPWPVVAEVGRQLLNAAAWLESIHLQHGQIGLPNVRVSSNGRTTLVSPFAFRLQHSHLSFSTDLKLKDVDSLAPELVSTGTMANSQSELYSIGCVLWQMLTARPVFLPADPIRRILKAREEDVADVRTLVPDCPDWMARLIQGLTRRSPELRPTSIKLVWQQWCEDAGKSLSATRRLLRRMPDRKHRDAKSVATTTKGNRLSAVVAATLMILMFAGYGLHRGLIPMPVSVSGAKEMPTEQDPNALRSVEMQPEVSPTPDVETTARGYLALPAPDAGGVVLLQSGNTYEAAPLNYPGALYVEADGSEPAIVVVAPDEKWSVTAAQISLNGLQVQTIRQKRSSQRTPSREPLLECRSDVVTARQCVIQTHGRNCGLHWYPSTGLTGVVSLQNAVLLGDGYGLRLSGAADRCELRNCLFGTEGSAVRLDVVADQKVPAFKLNQVTQVSGRAFMDVAVKSQGRDLLRIETECGESVLAPAAALIRLAGTEDWQAQNVQLDFRLPERGNPTIIPPGVDPVIHFDRSLKQLVGLSESQVVAEALLIAEPEFRQTGADEENPFAQYELTDYEGPKLNSQLPGVKIETLPEIIEVTLSEQ